MSEGVEASPPTAPPSPAFVARMVRNVLANEAGLSPSMIRRVIEETVVREVRAALRNNGVVERLVKAAVVDEVFPSGGHGRDMMRRALGNAMEAEARAIVRERLHLSVSLNAERERPRVEQGVKDHA